jgi:hypothetical protein
MWTEESTRHLFAGASHLLTQQTETLERQVSHFYNDLQCRLATFQALQRYLDRDLVLRFRNNVMVGLPFFHQSIGSPALVTWTLIVKRST